MYRACYRVWQKSPLPNIAQEFQSKMSRRVVMTYHVTPGSLSNPLSPASRSLPPSPGRHLHSIGLWLSTQCLLAGLNGLSFFEQIFLLDDCLQTIVEVIQENISVLRRNLVGFCDSQQIQLSNTLLSKSFNVAKINSEIYLIEFTRIIWNLPEFAFLETQTLFGKNPPLYIKSPVIPRFNHSCFCNQAS